jgi:uncharacterized protein (TIGR03118 family)
MKESVMWNKTSQPTGLNCQCRHLYVLGLSAVLALISNSAAAKGSTAPPPTSQTKQAYLVSDVPDVSPLQDTYLVNAWGISCSPTSPFWVSANGTGMATVYSITNDALGAPHVSNVGLEVAIPGNGTITGQVCNNTTAFNGDQFIFASEDGTISGWRGALGVGAEILAARNSAVYTGITLVSTTTGPMLLAANFCEGKVDVYDGNMNLVGQYADSKAPAGYAPFNVQIAGGKIYVTFAKQDATKHNVVTGAGNGLIDVFTLSTGTFTRFASGSNAGGKLTGIDTPWGIALAPASYGTHANQLLIANHGNGTIIAFSTTGTSAGVLGSGKTTYVINGLWGLTFGNGAGAGVPGTLYYTAGSNYGSHGLLGYINP